MLGEEKSPNNKSRNFLSNPNFTISKINILSSFAIWKIAIPGFSKELDAPRNSESNPIFKF